MLRRQNVFRVIAVLGAFCTLSLSLASPHLHLHSEPHDAGATLRFSVHPCGPDSQHAPDHDDHEDQRTIQPQEMEWRRERSENGCLITPPGPALPAPGADFARIMRTAWELPTKPGRSCPNTQRLPIDLRGPPQFAV